MNTQQLFDNYIIPSVGRLPLSFIEGKGSWLTEENGEKYYVYNGEKRTFYKQMTEVWNINKVKRDEIEALKLTFEQTIEYKIQISHQRLENITQKFPYIIENYLKNQQIKMENLKNLLESNNPKLKSKKGFVQISQNSKVIDVTELEENDMFEVQSDRFIIHSKVIQKIKI